MAPDEHLIVTLFGGRKRLQLTWAMRLSRTELPPSALLRDSASEPDTARAAEHCIVPFTPQLPLAV